MPRHELIPHPDSRTSNRYGDFVRFHRIHFEHDSGCATLETTYATGSRASAVYLVPEDVATLAAMCREALEAYTGRLFEISSENTEDGTWDFHTVKSFAKVAADNAHDTDYLAEVNALLVGQSVDVGGGSAPTFRTRRVS